MKKCIITTADIKRIKKSRDEAGTWTAINNLTPIKPLSDEDIDRMWCEATAGRMHIKLARAIERHIIGSETP